MSLRLYELVGQYKALESLESTDDLPAEVLRDTIEALEGDLHEKCTNVALFAANLDSSAKAIDVAVTRMKERAEVLRARAESLRAYLLLNMQSAGISKVASPWFTLTVKKNPGCVVVDHEGSIPEEFWVQPEAPPKRIDKAAIAAAIKAGTEVPGCHIYQGERLEIR